MLLIAVVALPLAWYVHRVREVARQQAAADAVRASILAEMNQIMKKIGDEEEFVSGEIARVKAPAKPSDATISEQLKRIAGPSGERAKPEKSPSAETVEQPR
jgi:hypothetical protein